MSVSNKTWDEPKSAMSTQGDGDSEAKYPPKYPYVGGHYTDSGHLFIMNDTPGGECIRIQHRNDSFMEFHPNGDIVIKAAKGNNYIIVANGNNNINVQGDYNLFASGDLSIESSGNLNLKVGGDFVKQVKGNVINIHDDEAGGGLHQSSAGDYSISSEKGNIVLTCGDPITSGKVIINADLVVNGSIKSQGNITAQGNVTSNETLFALQSIKTLGGLHVGPVSGMTPSVPLPGIATVDVGFTSPGYVMVGGVGIFGGVVTCLDAVFYNPGTMFSLHKHIAPLGPTSPPIPL